MGEQAWAAEVLSSDRTVPGVLMPKRARPGAARL